MRWFTLASALIILTGTLLATPLSARAEPPASAAFQRTWARTDQPVAAGQVSRTWMWGPQAFTGAMQEPYIDSPGGQREVQYFDKSRMEINDPNADPNDLWYVTNGLLANELMTGRMQIGDDTFEDRDPADVHIAGDPNPGAPSYAMLGELLDEAATPEGASITATLDSDGTTGNDDQLSDYDVTAAHYVDLTDHAVASVFWEFMNSTGVVYQDGQYAEDRLFENPFYGVGLPKTEAYWVWVPVAAVPQHVLVQCFERRCLTYTPGNPIAWQVEMGNIGQHYYCWRYGTFPGDDYPCGESAREYVYLDKIESSDQPPTRFDFPDDVATSPGSGAPVYMLGGGNRVQVLDAKGSYLDQWGGAGTEDGQFDRPSGIAVDAHGDVYVADSGNDRIQKFDRDGNYLGQWGSEGSGDGEFQSPEGIAVDSQGNVYVVDFGNHRIQKFTPDGDYLAQWGSEGSGDGRFRGPQDVTVDQYEVRGPVTTIDVELVFVTDTDNHRVQAFDTDGTLMGLWGGSGSGDGQFRDPWGLTTDDEGRVLVSDSGNHRLQRFDLIFSYDPTSGEMDVSAAYGLQWGEEGSKVGQFRFPLGIAAYGQRVHVADAGNNRAQIFNVSGDAVAFVDEWTHDGFWMNNPHGVAVTDARLSIADTDHHRVVVFGTDRSYLTHWGGRGTGNGEFETPTDVAIAPNGNVYVLEFDSRAQVFDQDGSYLSQWDHDSPYASSIAIDDQGDVYIVDTGNHRVLKYSANSTFITKWGGSGSGDGEFRDPFGIAISGETVYVTDAGNGRVQAFDLQGNYRFQWDNNGGLDRPWGIATDNEGDVYVADSGNRRVQKFAPDGTYITQWGTAGSADGKFVGPRGIAVDDRGVVYVTDVGTDRVQIFEPVDVN